MLLFVQGGPNTLDTMHVWNFNVNGDRDSGAKDVEIHVSTDEHTENLRQLTTSGGGTTDNGHGVTVVGHHCLRWP